MAYSDQKISNKKTFIIIIHILKTNKTMIFEQFLDVRVYCFYGYSGMHTLFGQIQKLFLAWIYYRKKS